MLLQHYGLPVIVALNRFGSDTERDFEMIRKHLGEQGVEALVCEHFANGSKGATNLAKSTVKYSFSTDPQRRDREQCARCGGRLKMIASIEERKDAAFFQKQAVEVRVLARRVAKVKQIARELRISKNTVKRYLRIRRRAIQAAATDPNVNAPTEGPI